MAASVIFGGNTQSREQSWAVIFPYTLNITIKKFNNVSVPTGGFCTARADIIGRQIKRVVRERFTVAFGILQLAGNSI